MEYLQDLVEEFLSGGTDVINFGTELNLSLTRFLIVNARLMNGEKLCDPCHDLIRIMLSSTQGNS